MEYSSYKGYMSTELIRSTVIYLASSVDDVTIIFSVLVLDRLCEGVLDGWVISLHEMPFDKLHH